MSVTGQEKSLSLTTGIVIIAVFLMSNCSLEKLTFPIEQDNNNICHYLARFRRYSKVTSRSLQMVDLSLWPHHHC